MCASGMKSIMLAAQSIACGARVCWTQEYVFWGKVSFFRLKADVYLVNCVTNEINALS